MTDEIDHASPTDESIDKNRRATLRLAGAAAAGVAGLAATSGSATAQWFSDGVEEFDLDGFGVADELPSSDESELVIYLHGGGVSSTADEQGQSLEDGLASAGYETTVIAGVFSTTSVGIGAETSDAAENLAALVEDYYDATDGSIRIVGYSLGGILTMQTLNVLEDGYAVDTAASLGTGTPSTTVCEDGIYHDGIATATEEFRVLVSEDDDAVELMDAMEPDCGGFFGGGSPPETFTRVDVTDDVDNHMVYLESKDVMEDLADSFDDNS
ncbi:lipase family protein [Halostagnicola bangensis]